MSKIFTCAIFYVLFCTKSLKSSVCTAPTAYVNLRCPHFKCLTATVAMRHLGDSTNCKYFPHHTQLALILLAVAQFVFCWSFIFWF